MPKPTARSSITPASSVQSLPVQLSVRISGELRDTGQTVTRYQTTIDLENRIIMTPQSNDAQIGNAIGHITVGHGSKVPDVYGQYSSHEIYIEISIPATRDEILAGPESIVDHWQNRAAGMQRRTFNEVLRSVGRDPIFAEVPETEADVDGEPADGE